MTHTFEQDDRVKITNHNSAFNNHVGNVYTLNHHMVWIKFEGSHGQPIGFDVSTVRHFPVPQLDDRVKILKSGKWQAQEGSVVTANESVVQVDLDYEVVSFDHNDVEVIESFGPRKRVEGRSIEFKDVVVGDTIETETDTVDNGVQTTTIRKGVVGQIDPGHTILKTRGGSYLHGFGNTGKDTQSYRIKLVKAVESDKVLMALKNLPRESIITFRMGTKNDMNVAVHLGGEAWNVMSNASTKSTNVINVRETIRVAANDTYVLVQNGARSHG